MPKAPLGEKRVQNYAFFTKRPNIFVLFRNSLYFCTEMKKTTHLIIAYALMCVCASAQIKVSQTEYDLGELGWRIPKSQQITLHNKSRHAVILTDLRTDCGCTTAVWQKGQLIESGQNATISVTYDAATLGHFKKGLRVITTGHDGKQQETTLWIKGQVLPEIIDYSQEYPYAIGEGIYLSGAEVEFDNVQQGERPVQTLRIVNGSKQNYTPTLMHLPHWLKVDSQPQVLRPGNSGILTFTAHADEIHNFGLTQAPIYVSRFAGDKVSHNNEIQVSMTLVPKVNTNPQALHQAPRAEVDTVVIISERGAKGARRLNGTVTITNTGVGVLEINRMQVYNTGLQVSINKSKIKPGQSTTLRVTGWSDREKAMQHKGRKRILLITNDPLHPQIAIDVKEEK